MNLASTFLVNCARNSINLFFMNTCLYYLLSIAYFNHRLYIHFNIFFSPHSPLDGIDHKIGLSSVSLPGDPSTSPSKEAFLFRIICPERDSNLGLQQPLYLNLNENLNHTAPAAGQKLVLLVFKFSIQNTLSVSTNWKLDSILAYSLQGTNSLID